MSEKIFMPILRVSEEYGIPLRTVYARIKAGHYETNANKEVNLADVERYINEPIKRGRKWKK